MRVTASGSKFTFNDFLPLIIVGIAIPILLFGPKVIYNILILIGG